ncbi:MAG: hypothetical protein AUJ98_05300 [Bacteroidetes bacterium CG2_30_33_31]|nr:MAG: hypothetical protein AUJ98_05300 [Bacteroidetes bacterium CG2_30_33_31]
MKLAKKRVKFRNCLNSGNNKGRITKVQDASTIQQFSYGMLGEVIKNIRTFVMPGGQDYNTPQK